jgi:hypothetical protein
MKEHQFFVGKLAVIFFHHCFAFQIIMLINFSILYSFDSDNLIRSSFVECSVDILVFLTAGGQTELVEFASCTGWNIIPVIWNLKMDTRHI